MKILKLFLTLLFCMLFFIACEKDHESGSFEPLNQNMNGKIKRIVNYDDSGEEFLIKSFSYNESNKITQININFTKPLFGAYNQIHRISYLSDKVIYIIETDETGAFLPAGKYEFKTQNDVPIEYIWFVYEDGQYVESKKVFYEYTDSRLLRVKVFFNISGVYMQKGQIDINYALNGVKDIFSYSSNQDDELVLNVKRIYNYEDGKLHDWMVSVKDDNGNWNDATKWIFSYSGNMVSEIQKLQSYYGTWEQASPITEYYYDNNKRLIRIVSGDAETLAEYESGSVDKTFFHLPEDQFFYEPQF